MPEIFASILHDENDVMLCKNEEHKVPRVQSAMEMMHNVMHLVMIPGNSIKLLLKNYW